MTSAAGKSRAERAAIAKKFFAEQFQIADNKTCVDCMRKNAQWASVSYGTFMCIEVPPTRNCCWTSRGGIQ